MYKPFKTAHEQLKTFYSLKKYHIFRTCKFQWDCKGKIIRQSGSTKRQKYEQGEKNGDRRIVKFCCVLFLRERN